MRFGRVRLREMIAAGGMAELHLGDLELLPGVTRTVVVKRLLPDHRDDPEYSTMLLDEARIIAELAHPSVVQLLDAVSVEEEWLLVFEYVPGVSLRKVLSRLPAIGQTMLAPELAAGIALSLAETLEYVHNACDASGRPLEIVHRDLNPSNVMLSRFGPIKLIDFGIARGQVRVYQTATGTLKGTCGYMAPEQLTEGARVDSRADVFAFGVMLYELFIGEHPFVGRTPVELWEKLTTGTYDLPAKRAAIPDALAVLIQRCLAVDPAARPHGMLEVARALGAVCRAMGWFPLAAERAALVQAIEALGVPDSAEIPLDSPETWITEVD